MAEFDFDSLPEEEKQRLQSLRAKYLAELKANVALLKEQVKDFDMTDEEMLSQVSYERIILHEMAAEIKNEYAALKTEDYIGKIKFKGNTVRIAVLSMDTSGTPLAQLNNINLAKSLTKSAENIAIKNDLIVRCANMVTVIDPSKISKDVPIEERLRYAIDVYRQSNMGWAFKSALLGEFGNLGIRVKEEYAGRLKDIGDYGETYGGRAGQIVDTAADEAFLTMPFEKLSIDQLFSLTGELYLKGIHLYELEAKYQDKNTKSVFGETIENDPESPVIEEIPPVYGDVDLSSLSEVRRFYCNIRDNLSVNYAVLSPECLEIAKEFETSINDAEKVMRVFEGREISDIPGSYTVEDLREGIHGIMDCAKALKAYAKDHMADSPETYAAYQRMAEQAIALTKDISASKPEDFTAFVYYANVKTEEEKRLSNIPYIDAYAAAAADFGYRRNNSEIDGELKEIAEWGLNCLDINMNPDYAGTREFIYSFAQWRAQAILELGREAQKLQRETGMNELAAAQAAFMYSAVGKKLSGISNAFGMADCPDEVLAEYKKVFKIKNIHNNIQEYMLSVWDDVGTAFANGLTPEERHIFELGQNGINSEIKAEAHSLEAEKYLVGYAREQQKANREAMPEKLEMPLYADCRNNLLEIYEMANDLKNTDSRLHHNSKKFRDLKASIENYCEAVDAIAGLDNDKVSLITHEQRKAISDAAADLTKKLEIYLGSKWKDRKTDIGKKRFPKAMRLFQRINEHNADILTRGLNATRAENGLANLNVEPKPFVPTDKIIRGHVDTRVESRIDNLNDDANHIQDEIPAEKDVEDWHPGVGVYLREFIDKKKDSLLYSMTIPLRFNRTIMKTDLAVIMLAGAKTNEQLYTEYGNAKKLENAAIAFSKTKEFEAVTKDITKENLEEKLKDKELPGKLMRSILRLREENLRLGAPPEVRPRSKTVVNGLDISGK